LFKYICNNTKWYKTTLKQFKILKGFLIASHQTDCSKLFLLHQPHIEKGKIITKENATQNQIVLRFLVSINAKNNYNKTASTKARSQGRHCILQVTPVDGNMEAAHTNTTS